MHECVAWHMRALSVLSLCDININGRLMRQALDQGGHDALAWPTSPAHFTHRCQTSQNAEQDELVPWLNLPLGWSTTGHG